MPSFSRSSSPVGDPCRPAPSCSVARCWRPSALDGCKTRELHPDNLDLTGWTAVFPHHSNVDIMFVIDDSSDMALAQDNLIRDFPGFMSTLQGDPAGPRNVHIAVVSQDMGAGGIAGCDDDSNGLSPGGKKGIFQYTPRGTCSATGLTPGATYI